MNKPMTVQVNETEQQLIEIINKSGLSSFCVKTILNNIYIQLDSIEKEEIKKYNDYVNNKNKKKESEK